MPKQPHRRGWAALVIADTHIGSNTALALPEFTNDDDQQIIASHQQRALYAAWLDMIEFARMMQAEYLKFVVIHLGDIIEGSHHDATQIMPNVEDQERQAGILLQPLAEISKGHFYCCRGTSAHAGEAAQSEVSITQEIGGRSCLWQQFIDLDGCLLDCAHNGARGVKTKAQQVMLSYARRGKAPPAYALRAHIHHVRDSGVDLPTRYITAPCWKLPDGYGYKYVDTPPDIGYTTIINGILDVVRYMPQEREVVRI
jgi:hypothetical protein